MNENADQNSSKFPEWKEALSKACGFSFEITPQPLEAKKLTFWERLVGWIKNRLPFRVQIQLLRLYTDGYDTYVAFSSEDAEKAYEEIVGESRNKDSEPWRAISLSAQLPIYSEDKLKHYPVFAKFKKDEYVGWIVIAPAWAWILDNGRGFLCSTEY